jgi:hypothetical protein
MAANAEHMKEQKSPNALHIASIFMLRATKAGQKGNGELDSGLLYLYNEP